MVKAASKSSTKPTRTTTKPANPDRQHPVTGSAVLALLADILRTRQTNDDNAWGAIAHDAAHEVGRTLALVPPSTPEEALAAICLLYSEAERVDQSHDWSEEKALEWSTRMKARAIALAAWIETAHGIKRETYGLEFFCNPHDEQDLLPHSPPHPLSRIGVAPLRAGFDALNETA
jgi:hypothetical protein